jgi:UDP-N-acetylglucosamine acyltransferase
MPEIHSSAIVEDSVALADDVVVGPGCVLEGDVRVGPGCRLIGRVYLVGPLTMGAGNTMYPGVSLGFAPQSIGYDPQEPGRGLAIGDGNTFRENVTVHRAMTDEGPTRIGNRNYLMANAHAGHDCQVGDGNIFANGVCLAGHVEIGDRVNIGGLGTVGQHARIGRGAMISGNIGIGADLAPFFMATALHRVGSINIIGMRRQGLTHDQIDDVRWVYRTLHRRGLTLANAVTVLQERADRPMVREYITFIEGTRNGLVTARTKSARAPAEV